MGAWNVPADDGLDAVMSQLCLTGGPCECRLGWAAAVNCGDESGQYGIRQPLPRSPQSAADPFSRFLNSAGTLRFSCWSLDTVAHYVDVPRFVRRDWLASEVGERLIDPSCRMAPCWRAWFPVVELVLVYTTRARFRHVSAPRSWRLWRQ